METKIAKQTLADIEARHNDILKLEQRKHSRALLLINNDINNFFLFFLMLLNAYNEDKKKLFC